jgi:hypothetical protein
VPIEQSTEGPAASADTPGVRQITLATNDLVYDPLRQRIYASVPSSAGVIGNSLTQIDPFAGTIGASVFIGSEPGRLEISDNSQYIYAALDGAAAVRRFDLDSQTPGLQFSLGSHPSWGPLFVNDLAIVPGQPNSVAISRKYLPVSPAHAGVAIYDSGVPRPTTTPTHTGSDVIEFSESDATLYGYSSEGDSGLRKMAISSSGVSVVSTTRYLVDGVDIRYADGLIYSTDGRVIQPEMPAIVGSFSRVDDWETLVAPVPSAGRVYFLTKTNSSVRTLKAFDLTTFVQVGSLTISGVSGVPGSLIKWGDDGLAFRTSDGQIFLVSIASIVPIPPSPIPSPVQLADGIIRLDLTTGDLTYDSHTQQVFASLPSAAGTFGNSLAPINPQTGEMGSPVFLGSEPGKLAISANGQFIYAGLDGSASVRKFDVASSTAGLQFAVGVSQSDGPMSVNDMKVLPGAPNSIAVSRRQLAYGWHEGVGIYDDGVLRSVTTPSYPASNVIEVSSAASTLYGYNNESSSFGFNTMAVSPAGVSVTSTVSNVISGYDANIKYDRGYIYASTGRVIDPGTGTIAGTFMGVNSQAFVPDSTVNRVYFVTGNGNSTTLQAFEQNTFLPVGSLSIPGVIGDPLGLIRCGSSGLALRTSGNQVFFIRAALVLTPVRIDTVMSPVGRTSGGQQIVLSGEFAGLSAVTMGGSAAQWSYTNGSGDTSTITVTTPPHAVGAVNIVLTTTSGGSLTMTNGFGYVPTVFTDDTIVVGETMAKGQHILELRQGVDAMRALSGLAGAPWADPSLASGDSIKAVHITQLRMFLDDAATRLGLGTSPYTDPGLAAGFGIKRIHIEELRQRVRTIAG